MTKFTTFFGLHFTVNIFSGSEQLSTTMQAKGILAQTVMAGVQCLKDNLQHQRNDYDVFFGQISDKAAVLGMVEEPTLPRPHKVPRRFQHDDTLRDTNLNQRNPCFAHSILRRLMSVWLS